VQLYLPIAEIPVNIFLILAMGAAVGFVSGMFGIGGGFLMTPLLIFVGIAPAVAVASVASHIAASSFSGAISYWRRRAIDPALALVLLSGGIVGTALGVWTFTLLRSLGQLDLMIALSYVVLLSAVGALMFWEGLRAILRARRGVAVPMRRSGSHGWIHGLPLKMRFKRSKIYLSVIPVVVRHHAACGHQPSGRCRAGADPDDRRRHRGAVRRPRRPEDSRRTSAAAARASDSGGRNQVRDRTDHPA
jgi:uncharacterized protein